jgi:serine/threonine-protein kinase RsbT
LAPPVEHLAVTSQADVDRVRREARSLARALSFPRDETEMVILAVVELATNLVRYGTSGSIALSPLLVEGRAGIQVESTDAGPGIADVELAMADGYSTGGGFGSGLPGVRRLMDDFSITTHPNGTRIVCRKWVTAS